MTEVGSAAAVLAAADSLLVGWLALARLRYARVEGRQRELEERLRPTALAVIDEGAEPALASAAEAEALAELLARHARRLHGDARRSIGAFCERSGAVARVLRKLGDKRPWVRAEAAFRLGDLCSEAAVPPLVLALRDPDADVRAAAARSLGRLGAAAAVATIVDLAVHDMLPDAVVGRALLDIGRPALPSLRRLAQHGRPSVRAHAVELLGLLGDPSDAPLVAERLLDGDPTVRARAAAALGRLDAVDAEQALLDLLDDPAEEVRTAAAEMLGSIGSDDAVDALVETARSDSFEPAQAAARAIVRLGAAEACVADDSPHLVEAHDLQPLA